MKFRPGAFRGLFGRPVSEVTDKVLPIEDVFGTSDAARIEALEALNAGVKSSLTDLAYELGYFDQAHFTKTFQSLTGYSPSEYRKT